MLYYQEITLIEQAEISPYFIWSKLYAQLHLAFVEQKDEQGKTTFGVSFPQYLYKKDDPKKSKITLGKKLRLFAQNEADLTRLDIKKWLERLNDYVHISSIRSVPQDKITGYAVFKRKQIKTNAERLARHRVKRGDIGFDEALARYSQVVTTTNLPYIQMASLSNSTECDKKQFKLFIEKSVGTKTQEYEFSTYGLSSKNAIPEF